MKERNSYRDIIERDNFDDKAEQFLQTFYPLALIEPMELPVRRVAEIMKLDVKEVYITRNASVFGRIFFEDCTTEYFDAVVRVYRLKEVKKGTVFVDPRTCFMNDMGCIRHTIIHECVHWYIYKGLCAADGFDDDSISSISCQVNETRREKSEWTLVDWMEWQAHGITSRILMPAETTRTKIEDLIRKNKKPFTQIEYSGILEIVLYELAAFFQVSDTLAKTRMIDLGYDEVMGVHINATFHSEQPLHQGGVKDNQTYTISFLNARQEYITNPEFSECIDTGRYLYLDGHFCINESKYIQVRGDGAAEMAPYAKEHRDECCLVFDLCYGKNQNYGSDLYKQEAVYRNLVQEKTAYISFNKERSSRNINREMIGDISAKDYFKWVVGVIKELPERFGEALVYLMKKMKISIRILADRTLLNEKVIQRMRNGSTRLKVNKVVAVCIGLNLCPQISTEMLKRAGYTLGINEEERAYQMLLDTCYNMSISEYHNNYAYNILSSDRSLFRRNSMVVY